MIKDSIIILKCGHKPNATNGAGEPCCAICAPSPESREIDRVVDLKDRKCKCSLCKKVVPSNEHIAFFEYKPDDEFDSHYDGCMGWD